MGRYYKIWAGGRWEVRHTNNLDFLQVEDRELDADQYIARAQGQPLPWAVVGQHIQVIEPLWMVSGIGRVKNPNYGLVHPAIVTRVHGDEVDALVYHLDPCSQSCLPYRALKPVYRALETCLCWAPVLGLS